MFNSIHLSYSPGLKQLLFKEIKNLCPEATISAASNFVELKNPTNKDVATIINQSRLCSRLLVPLKEFYAWGAEDLYEQVKEIEWSEWLKKGQTFGIYSHGKTDGCDYTSQFANLKIKDGIVDYFRKRENDRPSVDRHEPDLRIEAHFFEGKVFLHADLLGIPLHKRGYRLEEGPAPLRESRAAALLDFLGYSGIEDLCDPFCGSGTIAIEAALQSIGKAPGVMKRWETKIPRFKTLNDEIFKTKEELKAKQLKEAPQGRIYAYDRDDDQLRRAEANARRAGVDHLIKFKKQKAQTLNFHGLIATNPPYGERLDEKGHSLELLENFFTQLKNNCQGSTLAMVIPDHLLKELNTSKGPEKTITVPAAKLNTLFALYRFSELKNKE